jgi:hypothetical protein
VSDNPAFRFMLCLQLGNEDVRPFISTATEGSSDIPDYQRCQQSEEKFRRLELQVSILMLCRPGWQSRKEVSLFLSVPGSFCGRSLMFPLKNLLVGLADNVMLTCS